MAWLALFAASTGDLLSSVDNILSWFLHGTQDTQNLLFSHSCGNFMTKDEKEDCNEYFFLSLLQEPNIAEIPRWWWNFIFLPAWPNLTSWTFRMVIENTKDDLRHQAEILNQEGRKRYIVLLTIWTYFMQNSLRDNKHRSSWSYFQSFFRLEYLGLDAKFIDSIWRNLTDLSELSIRHMQCHDKGELSRSSSCRSAQCWLQRGN